MRAVGCDILFDDIFRTESPIVLHSVFSHAANMLCDDVVYAIVSRDGYNAPATAVVDGSGLFTHLVEREGSYVIRRGSSLLFETGDVMDCGACARSDVRLRSHMWDPVTAERGVQAYDACMREHVPKADTLAFYAAWYSGVPASASDFSLPLADVLDNLIKAIRIGEAFDEAVLNVLGAGMGLTPSGDDFLCGVLCVFAGATNPAAMELRKRLRRCLTEDRLVSRTTIVSASMLENACRGMAASPYRAFVDAVLSCPEDVATCFDGLFAVGATSGVDFSVGVVCAVRLLLEQRY